MPFRDMIRYVLHDVQANREGAFSLEEPTPIDPRLLPTESTASSPVSTSPTLPSKLQGRGLYNKSRNKRVKDKDKTEEAGTPPPKKVDLGVVISGFSKEIKQARRAKESFMTI